jgi:hypothetical protein
MTRKWQLFLVVFMAFFAAPAMSSIIKKPPAKPSEILYKDLVCTEADRMNIYEIISTMAEKGKLGLLFQQNHLREVGSQINHVHPLKFLAVIIKDPHLKSCMFYIWDDYFKRNGFLDGLTPSLTREAEKGKLDAYIKDFADDIGASHETLKSYFDVRDWENMVLFLIQS